MQPATCQLHSLTHLHAQTLDLAIHCVAYFQVLNFLLSVASKLNMKSYMYRTMYRPVGTPAISRSPKDQLKYLVEA